MPYYDRPTVRKPDGGFVVYLAYVVLAAIGGLTLAIALGGPLLNKTPPSWGGMTGPPSGPSSDRRFDDFAADDKDLSPLLAELKADFPDDYARLGDEMSGMFRRPVSDDELRAAVFGHVRHFMLVNFVDIEVAPSDRLRSISDAHLAVVTALQSASPEQCAQYDNGTLATDAPIAPGPRAAMVHLMRAELAAVAAGRHTPVEHGELSAAERATYDRAIAKSLSRADLALLGDGEKLAAAPVKQQCRISLAIAKAVNTLPAELVGKVTAEGIRADAQPFDKGS